MDEGHPIIEMLSWRTRLLSKDEIIMTLAALARVGNEPFTLTDLLKLLPEKLHEKKKRRSLSSMLSTLSKIGYLSKPSERKWLKTSSTLSHFLSPSLIELGELEKKVKVYYKEDRVIKLKDAKKIQHSK